MLLLRASVFQRVGGRDPSLPQSKRDSSHILLISAAPQAQSLSEVHKSGGILEKLGESRHLHTSDAPSSHNNQQVPNYLHTCVCVLFMTRFTRLAGEFIPGFFIELFCLPLVFPTYPQSVKACVYSANCICCYRAASKNANNRFKTDGRAFQPRRGEVFSFDLTRRPRRLCFLCYGGKFRNLFLYLKCVSGKTTKSNLVLLIPTDP